MFIACEAALDFGRYLGTNNTFNRLFQKNQTKIKEIENLAITSFGDCRLDYLPEVHDPDRDPQFNIPYATFNPFGKGIRIISDGGAFIMAVNAAAKNVTSSSSFINDHFVGETPEYQSMFNAIQKDLQIKRMTIDIFPHGVGSIVFHCLLPDAAITVLPPIIGSFDDVFIRRVDKNVVRAIIDFKQGICEALATKDISEGDRSSTSGKATPSYAGETIDSFSGIATTSDVVSYDAFCDKPGYPKIQLVRGDSGPVAAGWIVTVQRQDNVENEYKFDMDRIVYLRKTLDVMWWLAKAFERYLTLESEEQFRSALTKEIFPSSTQHLRFLSASILGNLQIFSVSHAQNDIIFLDSFDSDAQIQRRVDRIQNVATAMARLARDRAANNETKYQRKFQAWGLVFAIMGLVGVIFSGLSLVQALHEIHVQDSSFDNLLSSHSLSFAHVMWATFFLTLICSVLFAGSMFFLLFGGFREVLGWFGGLSGDPGEKD